MKWTGLFLLCLYAFAATMVAVVAELTVRDRDDTIHTIVAIGLRQSDLQRVFCDQVKTALVDLRDDLVSTDPYRDDVARVAGAAHLVVLDVRFCAGNDTIPDIGDAIISGKRDKIVEELNRLIAVWRK